MTAPVAAASLAVALTACSGSGSGTPSANPVTASTPPPDEPSSGPPATTPHDAREHATRSGTPSSTSTGGASSSRAAGQKLLRAGATAERTVKNSTLISIETEAGGSRWEVQVVTADGVEHEMDVSRDGAKVVTGPTTKHEDPSDEAKHRNRVEAAKIDYRHAAERATGAVKDGRVAELNLDTYRGTTVWEADVIGRSGTKHSVKIDARTGRVIVSRPGSD